MKISTRGRYGVRLLLDLAKHGSEPHVSLAEIAERQYISARYLEQVAVILRRAGYIRSVKGASGGYTLARDPSGIIIGDVLRVLEGDMLLVDDLRPGEAETKIQRCIRQTVYNRLNQRVSAVVDRLTLSSMLDSGKDKGSYMYFI
jgi:Rrf2 family cysteine metabolism transcriptional repressor